MSQLAEQLSVADQICTEAFPFFERAVGIREDALQQAAKEKKPQKLISVGIGFIGLLVGAWLGDVIKIGAMLGFITAAAAGILYYKKVSLPKINAKVEAANKRAVAEEAKGTQYLDDNAAALSVIPSEYWYPMATNYLLKVVQTGRADTVNQALQMYDEQLHRWKVEEANASILAQQQAQTEALKGIRKSSAINAAANVVNAAANVSRWF